MFHQKTVPTLAMFSYDIIVRILHTNLSVHSVARRSLFLLSFILSDKARNFKLNEKCTKLVSSGDRHDDRIISDCDYNLATNNSMETWTFNKKCVSWLPTTECWCIPILILKALWDFQSCEFVVKYLNLFFFVFCRMSDVTSLLWQHRATIVTPWSS